MEDEDSEGGASGQVEAAFKPREDLIEVIMTLGFSRNASIKVDFVIWYGLNM